MLLIDEYRGRNVAASCGVTVIGVLGILLESIVDCGSETRWRF
jgi:predicted nucleic acid-binding protein